LTSGRGPKGEIDLAKLPRGFLTEEERKNRPKITKAMLSRIFSYLRPYWKQLLLVFFSIIASSILGLYPSIITGQIVDEVVAGQNAVSHNMTTLIRLMILAGTTLVSSQVIGVLESYVNIWISQRIIYDMKNEMYQHLQGMPHAFFTTEKQGDIVTRMNGDVNGVSTVLSSTMSNILSNLTIVVTTMVALFSMSWQLALLGILAIPLLILPTKEVGKTRWQLLSKGQAKTDELNQVINETLSVSGSLLTKLFTREKKDYEQFKRINEEVTLWSTREQRSGKWFRMMMGMFSQAGPLLIYCAGGFMILKGMDAALSVGVITSTVALVNRLYRPLQSLTDVQVDITRSMALFTRIFDYLDRKNTILNKPDAVKPVMEKADIRFEHVQFAYAEGLEILKDIDFTLHGGEMFAIVGPSGAGKSTLVNMIPRLYDVTGGTVKIADVDVRDIDLSYLRAGIGMVTQDTYLFNGTIEENLRCAKEDATQEELEAACRVANIHDFITAQPGGYQTMVGNRGLKLSGGEKQRMSIARVVLKDPKILILDEATSSLDSISESHIQDALDALMKGRTSIVIAHRLSTVLAADQILVLSDGEIKERGRHEELMVLQGIYRDLFETQFRRAIDMHNEASANERALSER
jgi:ATP-binding cassette subfamily B protein